MSPRIFICDHIPPHTELMAVVLQEMGLFNNKPFYSGTEAIKSVYGGDIPALVITDYSIPEIDGVTLLCTIASLVSDLSGIIISFDVHRVLSRSEDYPVLDKSDPQFVFHLSDCVQSSLKGSRV